MHIDVEFSGGSCYTSRVGGADAKASKEGIPLQMVSCKKLELRGRELQKQTEFISRELRAHPPFELT